MARTLGQDQQAKEGGYFLVLTILCACIFLGVKYFEYSHKFEEGLLPGQLVQRTTATPIPGSHGYATFFAFYFMMTGLHGIHILVGIGLLPGSCCDGRARANFPGLLHTRRSGGPVLAHGRYDLDLSVPAVLLDHMSTHNEHTYSTHAHEPTAVNLSEDADRAAHPDAITVGAAYINSAPATW